jgi:predicted MFS family arabinose efflux permease
MNLVAFAIGIFVGNMLGARFIRRHPWKDCVILGAISALAAILFMSLFFKST